MLDTRKFVEDAKLRFMVVATQRSMRCLMQYSATPLLHVVYSNSSMTRYNDGLSAAKVYMFAGIIEDTPQRWSIYGKPSAGSMQKRSIRHETLRSVLS